MRYKSEDLVVFKSIGISISSYILGIEVFFAHGDIKSLLHSIE